MFKRKSNAGIKLSDAFDYEKAKKGLYFILAGKEADLEGVPYTMIQEFPVTYHILLDQGDEMDRNASLKVTEPLLDAWGISLDQLHADAMENTPKLFPAHLFPIETTIRKISEEEAWRNFEAGELCGMLVMSNDRGSYGAGSLFYPGQLEIIAEKMDGSFYAIPSAVHEFILMKDEGQEPEKINEMIRTNNGDAGVVDPKDILGNQVYHYDANTHIFQLGMDYAHMSLDRVLDGYEAERESLSIPVIDESEKRARCKARI